jgi:single-stranded-DNA-specific exonuclease
LGVSRAFARILARRGLRSPETAKAFLDPRLDALHDPSGLPDMERAVLRIEAAVRRKERVVLFGDYDVDGLTATALLARFFRLLRHPVEALAPERTQGGYGLTAESLSRIRQLRPGLLITLDNGTAAHKALEELRAEGVEAIVLDHHHVGVEGLPAAQAVVNPARADHDYPFRHLCGAALAFKLAWALAVRFSRSRRVNAEFRGFLLDAISLVALGTLADVAPLVGENRVLAAWGLKALRASRLPGLAALRELCRIEGAPQATEVTFRLAPRLNAAGRCGCAREALELLLCDDQARAAELGRRLEAHNRRRQSTERRILEEARAAAQARLSSDPTLAALVLHSPDWDAGVIGIVASRLVEEFNLPTVLMAVDGERGLARGSGRSVPGFHLAEALAGGGKHLVSHGGHAAAGGLTVRCERLAAFRAQFEETAAQRLKPEQRRPRLFIEEVLTLGEVNGELCRELERLEPCGEANERPVLAVRGVELRGAPRLCGNEEQHLHFHAGCGREVRRAIGFGMGPKFNALCDAAAGPLDLAFQPKLNTFRGETRVELQLRAFRASKEGGAEQLQTAAAGGG